MITRVEPLLWRCDSSCSFVFFVSAFLTWCCQAVRHHSLSFLILKLYMVSLILKLRLVRDLRFGLGKWLSTAWTWKGHVLGYSTSALCGEWILYPTIFLLTGFWKVLYSPFTSFLFNFVVRLRSPFRGISTKTAGKHLSINISRMICPDAWQCVLPNG